VFSINSALKIQCFVVKNTLLQTAFFGDFAHWENGATDGYFYLHVTNPKILIMRARINFVRIKFCHVRMIDCIRMRAA